LPFSALKCAKDKNISEKSPTLPFKREKFQKSKKKGISKKKLDIRQQAAAI
jgi:hypothetical protein